MGAALADCEGVVRTHTVLCSGVCGAGLVGVCFGGGMAGKQMAMGVGDGGASARDVVDHGRGGGMKGKG